MPDTAGTIPTNSPLEIEIIVGTVTPRHDTHLPCFPAQHDSHLLGPTLFLAGTKSYVEFTLAWYVGLLGHYYGKSAWFPFHHDTHDLGDTLHGFHGGK